MSKPGSTSADLRFFILWAIAGLLDLPVLSVALGAPCPIPPVWAALLHVLSAGAAFLAPPPDRGYFHPTRHWGEFLGAVTLALPGLGWFLSGWLVAWHGRLTHAKDAYRFDDDSEEDVNPLAAAGTAAAIRRELADALDAVPAADALLGRDPAMKRGAVEALAKIRTPEAIAWIFRARTDLDAEVRFYATSSLTQLKRDFETNIRAAEKEAFSRPGELAPQVSLQRIRFEYARSGLMEPAAQAELLGRCREALTAPAERDVEALRLLYYVERRQAKERALPILDRLLVAEPQRRDAWLRERVELFFELGLHAELKRLLQELRPGILGEGGAKADPDPEWRSAVLWWTHG